MRCFNTTFFKSNLIWIGLCLSTICFAQSHKTLDSLISIIKSHNEEDTTYVVLRIKYIAQKIYESPSDSLLEYNLETLKVAEKLNFKRGQIPLHSNNGVIYQYIIANPFKALDSYHKALKIIGNDTVFSEQRNVINSNIGLIYLEQEEYSKALESFEKVIEQDPENFRILSSIGTIYGKTKELDSATVYFKKSMELAKLNNSFIDIANSKSNLARVLIDLNRNNEALIEMEESLEIINKYNLGFLKPVAYLNAALVYLSNEDYEKTEEYSMKVMNFEDSINLSMKSSLWATLVEVYRAKRDYEKALNAYEKHYELKDSLTNSDRKLEISRKEIQFEADRKGLLAQEEIKRQKLIKNNSLFGGGILIVVLLFGGYLYKRKREAEFELNTKSAELKTLRTQMNPHFIFSSLNSVNNFISKTNTTANTYLTQFAKLMRKTLENSEKEDITLQEDIDLLNTYLNIEQNMLHDEFTHEILVDDALDAQNTLVPPMLLQPLVENSIKHGFARLKGNGHIKVQFKKKQNTLLCIVEDNGVGRKKAMEYSGGNTEKTSMSTEILQKRLDIINTKDKTSANFRIIDKENGTRVELELPFKVEFE